MPSTQLSSNELAETRTCERAHAVALAPWGAERDVCPGARLDSLPFNGPLPSVPEAPGLFRGDAPEQRSER
jgi:hypothetical protein